MEKMNENNKNDETKIASTDVESVPEQGFRKLSALELNNIKLNDKHTLLTPDYLEKMVKSS